MQQCPTACDAGTALLNTAHVLCETQTGGLLHLFGCYACSSANCCCLAAAKGELLSTQKPTAPKPYKPKPKPLEPYKLLIRRLTCQQLPLLLTPVQQAVRGLRQCGKVRRKGRCLAFC